jgi:hypothetical protein
MHKEIPILFSTPMVQAILEGRKTMTRIIVKDKTALQWLEPDMFTPEFVANPDNNLCRYGKPGDLLWVRESWCRACISEDGDNPIPGTGYKNYYRADDEWTKIEWHHPDKEGPQSSPRWKPSIHMPKAAARIWLEVTEVRVERLQDISEEDAQSEGVNKDCPIGNMNVFQSAPYKYCFADLWERINGEESWTNNPWVWVVSFKVLSTTGKPAQLQEATCTL